MANCANDDYEPHDHWLVLKSGNVIIDNRSTLVQIQAVAQTVNIRQDGNKSVLLRRLRDHARCKGVHENEIERIVTYANSKEKISNTVFLLGIKTRLSHILRIRGQQYDDAFVQSIIIPPGIHIKNMPNVSNIHDLRDRIRHVIDSRGHPESNYN